MIEFTDELKTGIDIFDEHHKRLIELINQTYNLLRDGKREEAMRVFTDEVVAYMEYHLTKEEEFMRSIGYPEYEQHKKAHEIFRKEILRLKPAIESGDVEAFRQKLAFVWGWLYTHIAKTDKKYGKYYEQLLKRQMS